MYLAADVHAITVSWVLLPLVGYEGFLAPFSATTLGLFGLSGTPVSSQLNMQEGLFKRSFDFKQSSSMSKYRVITSLSVAIALAREKGTAVRSAICGWRLIYLSHQPFDTTVEIFLLSTIRYTIAITSFLVRA